MGFSPIQLQLPKLQTQNLSNLGNVAKPSLPKPEAAQLGKGFSTKDTFEAAPQRAAAKQQPQAAKAATVGNATVGNATGGQKAQAQVGNAQIGNAGAQVGNAQGNAQIGNAGAQVGNAQGAGEAGGAGAAGGAAGGDLASQLQSIVQQLQQLLQQLTQLLQGLGGGAGAAGGGAGGGGEKAVAAGGGGGGAGGAGGAQGANAAGGAQGAAGVDPQLQDALNTISQDPDGAKLVQAAQAAGLKGIHVGNLPGGTMGEYQNGQITISPNALKSPQDLVRTLAHEMGHAATPQDGDSQLEEKTVDDVAQRIQQRVAPGKTYQLDLANEGQANVDNGIAKDLRAIGIQV